MDHEAGLLRSGPALRQRSRAAAQRAHRTEQVSRWAYGAGDSAHSMPHGVSSLSGQLAIPASL